MEAREEVQLSSYSMDEKQENFSSNGTTTSDSTDYYSTKKPAESTLVDINRYRACMILAAVGDAVGYKKGSWEFLTNGTILHKQFHEITKGKGMDGLKVDLEWRVSDDTIMHIATARALTSERLPKTHDLNSIGTQLAVEYKKCWKHMGGRAPGGTTAKSVSILEQDGTNWNKIPFREQAGGCGASMRAACIGLKYWRAEDEAQLIEVSIESGRITHHNPTAYLGAYVAALFTAYAIREISCERWGYLMINSLPTVKKYINDSDREVKLNMSNIDYFIDAWKDYLKLREIEDGLSEPVFPDDYNVLARERFYKKVSFSGWGGASGHDSVIIAYDALLGSKGDWNELCLRGVLHGGDNDSTGTIAAAWFGAIHGFQGIVKQNFKHVEFGGDCKKLGDKLHKMVQPQQKGLRRFLPHPMS